MSAMRSYDMFGDLFSSHPLSAERTALMEKTIEEIEGKVQQNINIEGLVKFKD